MQIKGVVIDPGHGGDDPGASGNNIIEKNITLDISKELAKDLEKYNIPVYLTRTTDETLSPKERTSRILNAFGNSNDVIVVSNHINAGGGDGAEVIYALRNTSTLSNKILNELEKEGQNIRKAYQRRSLTNPANDYYFIHRETGNTEPVIVEYGFLDSKNDDVEQLKNNYKKYADAVARAIASYIGLNVNDGEYTVKAGDTLWSISKNNNISVEELKKLNNLSSNLLSIGQKLKISSVENTNSDYYIVKKGDTLYSIARMYNLSVNTLIDQNKLETTKLSIGQKLYIKGNTYIVKKGDTLYNIALSNNTTVENIIKKNNLITSSLSIGQELKL